MDEFLNKSEAPRGFDPLGMRVVGYLRDYGLQTTLAQKVAIIEAVRHDDRPFHLAVHGTLVSHDLILPSREPVQWAEELPIEEIDEFDAEEFARRLCEKLGIPQPVRGQPFPTRMPGTSKID